MILMRIFNDAKGTIDHFRKHGIGEFTWIFLYYYDTSGTQTNFFCVQLFRNGYANAYHNVNTIPLLNTFLAPNNILLTFATSEHIYMAGGPV